MYKEGNIELRSDSNSVANGMTEKRQPKEGCGEVWGADGGWKSKGRVHMQREARVRGVLGKKQQYWGGEGV